MKQWTEWEITRRQVAIGGRVMDENKSPVDGALIKITSMPNEFRRKLAFAEDSARAGRSTAGTGPESAVARSDGIFFFLDLPDGQYTVTALDPGSGRHDEKNISVSRDKKQNIKMTQVEFTLHT